MKNKYLLVYLLLFMVILAMLSINVKNITFQNNLVYCYKTQHKTAYLVNAPNSGIPQNNTGTSSTPPAKNTSSPTPTMDTKTYMREKSSNKTKDTIKVKSTTPEKATKLEQEKKKSPSTKQELAKKDEKALKTEKVQTKEKFNLKEKIKPKEIPAKRP